jgi:hypothetical protein
MRGVCVSTVRAVMIQKQKNFTVNIFEVLNKAIKGCKRNNHVRTQ